MTKLPSEFRDALSSVGFRDLGNGEVAFLREMQAGDLAEILPEVRDLEPTMMLWALLGADGSPIIVSDTRQVAEADALERDMTIASVH
ncbi:DUF1150 family protein [Coralliovum pocilloporae]|uniref:BQ00720 family protein n=1 Tax=Coralliovum pocilloporae TaxID=3066369 RepID=UPI003306BC76